MIQRVVILVSSGVRSLLEKGIWGRGLVFLNRCLRVIASKALHTVVKLDSNGSFLGVHHGRWAVRCGCNPFVELRDILITEGSSKESAVSPIFGFLWNDSLLEILEGV